MSFRQADRLIERVQLEEITMPPDGRIRTGVPNAVGVVLPLNRAGWHGLCFESWQAGRKPAAHDNSSNTGKGALDRKVQGAFRLFGTGDFP